MLTEAIGVAVPAHNEQALLPACLAALRLAATRPGIPAVRLVVVADSCDDDTASIARAAGAEVVQVSLRNASAARACGLDLITASSRVPLEALWLATTDADSRVPPDWFVRQLQCRTDGWDAVVGIVAVDDWSAHRAQTAAQFARHYGAARDEHAHVHGANLGLSAAAYRRIGGFPRLALAEDHALVAALTRCGLRITRPGDLPVFTSARRHPRAAGGFGELLCSMELPDGEAASA